MAADAPASRPYLPDLYLSQQRFSPPMILVAEDDPGDQVLIREALESNPCRKQVQLVGDGEEALEYVRRSGRYATPAGGPPPDLILMDLNMPRLSGKEATARLKADPSTRSIPIVAFTTSNREEDISHCYAVGVNSYIQKPSDFDRLQEVLRQVERYWLEVCQPHRAR